MSPAFFSLRLLRILPSDKHSPLLCPFFLFFFNHATPRSRFPCKCMVPPRVSYLSSTLEPLYKHNIDPSLSLYVVVGRGGSPVAELFSVTFFRSLFAAWFPTSSSSRRRGPGESVVSLGLLCLSSLARDACPCASFAPKRLYTCACLWLLSHAVSTMACMHCLFPLPLSCLRLFCVLPPGTERTSS